MLLCRLVLMALVVTTLYCVVLLCQWQPGVMMWVILFAALAVIARRRYTRLTAFGTAIWASSDDCEAAGMLQGKGMIIGRMPATRHPILSATLGLFDRRVKSSVACERFITAIRRGVKPPELLVRLSRAVHTAVFCPTGGGKGTNCIIPFLQTSDESAVVIDFKGEIARLTAEYRRKKFGHRTILLDPLKVVTQTPDTLNPIQFIDKNSPFAIDDCREVGAGIVERKQESGDGVHFLDTAEATIAALTAMTVQFADGFDKSLQTVCIASAHPRQVEEEP